MSVSGQLDSKLNCIQIIGEHEHQISEDGEAGLLSCVVNCKKNPGHTNFIPVDSFALEHLPEFHQDIDLFDLIKATADLTLRISVTLTSPERPDFWPNTNIPYFLSNLRGKKTFRCGSGKVSGVWKERQSVCPCKKCKDSNKPRKVWWKVYVETAAHVVFDDIETKQVSFKLFYDREDSTAVIVKDDVAVHYINVERDLCWLRFPMCDRFVGYKLGKMWERYLDLLKKVCEKNEQTKDEARLNFIVSHPHGCLKQVSLGKWKDKIGEDKAYQQFTYTTCTCPGSSGASVHNVGYGKWGWWYHPVHSASLKSGLNCSGVGAVYF